MHIKNFTTKLKFVKLLPYYFGCMCGLQFECDNTNGTEIFNLKTYIRKDAMEGINRTIDGREYWLYGPNAEILKWIGGSPLGRKLFAKSEMDEDRLFLALSKHEMQAVAAKDAIRAFWYAYPEFGPYPFLDTLSKFEHEGVFYGDYRDHVIHQLKVYLLGLYIFDRCETIRKSVLAEAGTGDDFLRAWTLCALSHDIGYIMENDNALNPNDPAWVDTKKVMEEVLTAPVSALKKFSGLLNAGEERRICHDLNIRTFSLLAFDDLENAAGKNILSMIAETGKKASLGSSDSPFKAYWDYAFAFDPDPPARKRFRDHGVASALLLVQTWKQFQRHVDALAVADHPLLSDDAKTRLNDLKNELGRIEDMVLSTAGAVALHNVSPSLWKNHEDNMLARQLTLNRFKVRLGPDNKGLPLAFLLMLSDTIQDWDRYRFRELRSNDTPSISDQDMCIRVENATVFLDYKKDNNLRNPVIDENSRFNETKNALSSLLDPAIIQELVQWKGMMDENGTGSTVVHGFPDPQSSAKHSEPQVSDRPSEPQTTGEPSTPRAEASDPPFSPQNPGTRVFIICADEDDAVARRLHGDFKKIGLNPWLAGINIKVGQTPEQAFARVMEETDYVVALLSKHSLTKRGFAQKQLKKALDIFQEYPSGDIFLVPVQLDNTKAQDDVLRNLKSAVLHQGYKAGLGEIIRAVDEEKISMVSSSDISDAPIGEENGDPAEPENAPETNADPDFADLQNRVDQIERLFTQAHFGLAYEKFHELCRFDPSFENLAKAILRRHHHQENEKIAGIPLTESVAEISSSFQSLLRRFKQERKLG